jgi:hypothetical protein
MGGSIERPPTHLTVMARTDTAAAPNVVAKASARGPVPAPPSISDACLILGAHKHFNYLGYVCCRYTEGPVSSILTGKRITAELKIRPKVSGGPSKCSLSGSNSSLVFNNFTIIITTLVSAPKSWTIYSYSMLETRGRGSAASDQVIPAGDLDGHWFFCFE